MRGWMRVLGGIAIVAAIFLVVGLALMYTRGPGEDASDLVRQAAEALDKVAVEGTVLTVVRTPDGVDRVRAAMHRGGGRFTMRLLSGPGEGTQVHRQEGAVWVERAGGERVRRASLGEQEVRGELLGRNWTFTTAGTRRVAGRPTTLVRGTGPGGEITLAIDRKTGFPLHISRRDRQGELVSETTWLKADFSVQPPPKLEPPPAPDDRPRRKVTLEEARAAVAFTVLEPGWLPEGWELQGWFLNERPPGTMVIARFSDGLRPMMIMQLSAEEVRERLQQRREQRQERERPADTGDEQVRPPRERPQRPDRGDRPGRLERPDRPERSEHPMRGPMERRGPMHLRGAGADASRRTIDGTVVIVSGPIGEDTREKVLKSMTAP